MAATGQGHDEKKAGQSDCKWSEGVSRHDNSFLLSWRDAGIALFLFSPKWTAIDSYNGYDSSIHSTHSRMYEALDLFTGRYALGNALRILIDALSQNPAETSSTS